MPRDQASLLDLLHAARLATEFVTGLSKSLFLSDIKTQSAVLHQLLVMGEATKRLSRELREAHSRIPWSLVAGMRDRLVHGYDEVDLDEVWSTVERDVPELIEMLRPLVHEEPPEDEGP